MTTILRAHEDTVKWIFYIQLVNKETDLTFLEDNFTICIKSLKGGHILRASGNRTMPKNNGRTQNGKDC